ncbi:MAG: helix-turn-helix domain-containing protein [Prevotella sp.]|nr:helix-turn-helix domain-containing protein [Prevotella sp.]
MVCWMGVSAQTRHWGPQDGLPTGEVRQIVALPNHQMLINCEGVFCISNGAGFSVVPCDRRRAYLLAHYADSLGYGHRWQGDSLLWLRDFYRIYLFDMRTCSFRYDIDRRLSQAPVSHFLQGKEGDEAFVNNLRSVVDSLGMTNKCMVASSDWQGGLWVGTIDEGIYYFPPTRKKAETSYEEQLVSEAIKAVDFDVPLANGKNNDRGSRRLQRRGLNQLSYYYPEKNDLTSLNNSLPLLNKYRYIVGACAVDGSWVVLYTQNGACMLDTEADTLATFKPSETIGEYTDKYNCMVRGRDGTLWIGTQNGLFKTFKEETERVTGLVNNCIRSLVMDAQGNIWAGTACGISRITPNVVNYGEDDGIPSVSMMERAACLTDDGRLVFVHHGSTATVFRPEWLSFDATPCTPVLTAMFVNGLPAPSEVNAEPVPYVASQSLSLPYDENYLTFQFSSLDYAHHSHVRYRYRLRGLEDDWHTDSETIGLAYADYKALSPGEYVFEAQAAAADGLWSETLTIPVTIRPPFWLTWWAKTIYALLLCVFFAILLAFYLRRKKAALERENDNRVNRLFEMREEARHQFADNTNVDPKKIGVNPEEEALIAKLLKAVEAHIADEEYSVDQLASDVAMSRTNLYGKLRNMLGISPADFIRNVRLKRAAQLLAASPSLSINEVSARVGFSTPRNFSTQFKKMFGVLPSEYRGTENPQ